MGSGFLTIEHSKKKKIFFFKSLLFIVLGIYCNTFFYCSQGKKLPKDVLARVGKTDITVHDFRISYELFPAFSTESHLSIIDRKRIQLRSLIEQQLLVGKAVRDSALQAPRVKMLLKWYKNQAAIRALYRMKIRKNVHISEKEKETAFKELNSKLFLRQLFFKDSLKAYQAYSLLKSGISFKSAAQKYFKNKDMISYLMQPKSYTWGELDNHLETAAFKLQPGETSAPVKTKSGFHILQLVNKKSNILLTRYAFQNREHYIQTIIKRRREAVLARRYAKNMMEKIHPVLDKEIFERFKKALKNAGKEKNVKKMPAFLQIAMVRPYVKGFENSTIIHFKNGGWSVKKMLDQILGINPLKSFDLTDYANLPLHLSLLVLDNALSKTAMGLGLDRDSIAIREYKRDRNNVLALYEQKKMTSGIQVDSLDVKTYYDKHKKSYKTKPLYRIREVWTKSKEMADSLHRLVISGKNMSAVSRHFSQKKQLAKKSGDIGFITADAFGNIGKWASKLNEGQLSPVFPDVGTNGVSRGYAFIKLLNKLPVRQRRYRECRQEIENKIRSIAQEKIIRQFFLREKAKIPIYTNDKLLEKISVSDQGLQGKRVNLDNLHRF